MVLSILIPNGSRRIDPNTMIATGDIPRAVNGVFKAFTNDSTMRYFKVRFTSALEVPSGGVLTYFSMDRKLRAPCYTMPASGLISPLDLLTV